MEHSAMLLGTFLVFILTTVIQADQDNFQNVQMAFATPHTIEENWISNDHNDIADNILSELTDAELDSLLEELHIPKQQGDIILNKKQLVQKITNMELRNYKNRNLPNDVDLKNRTKGNNHEGEHTTGLIRKYKVQHLENKSQKNRVKRKMKTGYVQEWIFPIRFSFISSYSDEQKTKIRGALQNWEDATCASFTESNDTTAPAMYFEPLQGCYSNVGRDPSSINTVSLADSCFTTATIEHEVGHALGFYHEQSRPDRDSFITVNISNVDPEKSSNYDILSWDEALTYNIEYDYGSVMQYDKRAFTSNGGMTMVAKDGAYDNTLGQNVGLSFSDIKLFNTEYCSGSCNGYRNLEWKDCQHGGYRDPNNCNVCKCPDGWTGATCNTTSPPVNAVCGAELSVTTPGELMTPSYNVGYTKNTSCTWLLTADEGSQVTASFVGDFGIDCLNNAESGCDRDWVEVRYNDLQHTGPRFCCGTTPSGTFVSKGNQMMILFRSNTIFSGSTPIPNNGFKLQFTSTPRVGSLPCESLKQSGLSQSPKQLWRTGIFKLQSMPWNSRPVYKHLIEPVFMFYDSGYWLIGSTIGETQSGIRVFSSALQPLDVTEVWESFSGTSWVAESGLVTSCSAVCDRIWLSGVSRTGPHAYLLGAYSFSNNDSNGVPIYRKQDTTSSGEITISMSNGNKWSIVSESETITTSFTTPITNPVEVPNVWTVSSGTIVLECYFGPEENCSDVMLDGGSEQRSRQGIYSLYGSLLNGRPVYIHEDGVNFLFHVIIDQTSRFWYISTDIGNSLIGAIRVEDSAMSAEGITGTWEAYTIQDWVVETAMATSCITNNTAPSATLYIGGVITSSTPQTVRLGLYTLHGDYHNSRPVYIHESGNSYLYYYSGLWVIGSTIGENQFGIQTSAASLLPQEITEPLYGFVSSTGWTLMDGITISSYMDTGDGSCRELQLSGIGLSVLNDLYENNDQEVGSRPSYKISGGGINLYFIASNGIWVIGADPINTAAGYFAYTNDPAVDPTKTSNWNLYDGGFVPQPEVVWSCLDVTTSTTAVPTTTSPVLTTTPPVAMTTTTLVPTTSTTVSTNSIPGAISTTSVATSTTTVATSTTPLASTTTPLSTTSTHLPTTTAAEASTTISVTAISKGVTTMTTSVATSTTPVSTTTTHLPTTTAPEASTTTPVLLTTTSVPTTTIPLATTTISAATSTPPLPTTTTSIAATTTPAPTASTPLPAISTPVAISTTPVGTTITPSTPTTSTTSVATSTTTVPTSNTPVSTTSTPLPTTSTHVATATFIPTSTTPEPTTTTPLPTTTTPVATSTSPVATTSTPLPATTTTLSTTTTPVLTSTISLTTSAPPVATTITSLPTTSTLLLTTAPVPTSTTSITTSTTPLLTTPTPLPTSTTSVATNTPPVATATTTLPTTSTFIATSTSPAQTRTTTVETSIAPLPTTTTPVPTSTTASTTTSKALTSSATPVSSSTTPISTSTIPVGTTSTPLPTTTTPISTTTTLAPTDTSPLQSTYTPLLASSTPLPTTTTPLPTSTTSVPTSTTYVPTSTTQLPISTTSIAVTTTPVSTTTTTVATSTSPVATTITSLPTTSIPVSTSAIPLPTSTTPLPPTSTAVLTTTLTGSTTTTTILAPTTTVHTTETATLTSGSISTTLSLPTTTEDVTTSVSNNNTTVHTTSLTSESIGTTMSVSTTTEAVTTTESNACGRTTCPPGRVGDNCAKRGYAFSSVLRLNDEFSQTLKDEESVEYKDFEEKFLCTASEGYKNGGLTNRYRPFLKVENVTSGSILVAYSLTLEPLSTDDVNDPPTADLVKASFNVTAANQFGLLNYTAPPESTIDYDECSTQDSNDCHTNALCTNQIGSYTCACAFGFVDESADSTLPGRMCKAQSVFSSLELILIIVGGFLAVGLIFVIIAICYCMRTNSSRKDNLKEAEINRAYLGEDVSRKEIVYNANEERVPREVYGYDKRDTSVPNVIMAPNIDDEEYGQTYEYIQPENQYTIPRFTTSLAFNSNILAVKRDLPGPTRGNGEIYSRGAKEDARRPTLPPPTAKNTNIIQRENTYFTNGKSMINQNRQSQVYVNGNSNDLNRQNTYLQPMPGPSRSMATGDNQRVFRTSANVNPKRQSDINNAIVY